MKAPYLIIRKNMEAFCDFVCISELLVLQNLCSIPEIRLILKLFEWTVKKKKKVLWFCTRESQLSVFLEQNGFFFQMFGRLVCKVLNGLSV